MTRFALFETAELPLVAPSPSEATSSSHFGDPSPSSMIDSLSLLENPSERRSSSTTSMAAPGSCPSVGESTGPESSSIRASHSDTNLMERFRRGHFIASFVGVRKSFSLQKKRTKKNKNKRPEEGDTKETGKRPSSSADEPPEHAAIELTRFESTSEDEEPRPVLGEVCPPAMATCATDHSQPATSSTEASTSNVSPSASACAPVVGGKSGKRQSLSRLRSHHKESPSTCPPLEQSLKKSWLSPMSSFINCCLTRTDSLPDVHLEEPLARAAAAVSSQTVPSNCTSAHSSGPHEEVTIPIEDAVASQLNHHHPHEEILFDDGLLAHSLSDFYRGASARASPDLSLISQRAQSQSERERAFYLEEASEEAFFNESLNLPSCRALGGLPLEEEDIDFEELRRMLSSHQPASMSTFTHTHHNRLFPLANYPLHMGRGGPLLGATHRSAQAEIGDGLELGQLQGESSSSSTTSSAVSLPPLNATSPYSISSNLNSSLHPYAPPVRPQLYSPTGALVSSGMAPGNPVHTQIDYINCLVPHLRAISSCSFYWGKMDRYEAERLLEGKPEGTFLLRDSAQEDHLFSVSFRRFDRSLHARIEQFKHRFSFDSHDPGVYSSPTVTGLIEHYKDPSHCMFFEPMLTKPLNRSFVFGLQHLTRATICDSLRSYDQVNNLPLPIVLKSHLKDFHYKVKVRTKHFDEFTYLSNYYQ